MIICCGEALIDMLPRQSAAGEKVFLPCAGGAVFNTAIALGRLGNKVEFFSGISSDFFGEQLLSTLESSNVGQRYVVRSGQPTTLAFVTLNNGQAQYAFYDENTAGRLLSEQDLPVFDRATPPSALYFGAISLIPEPCGSAYEALMRREHRHCVTMLDPNIRPGFIPDPEAHKARLLRMIAMADIVKFSDEDLAWFGRGDDADAAASFLAEGPSVVLLTRGGEGATALTRRGQVEVAVPSVTVADTVGAGDTFNAGFLAALDDAGLLTKEQVAALDEAALREALDMGVRVAAVTVSRPGANPPYRRELA
ncbi:carbohydrate kinase [Granulosicoccaceae sp. 1_MG-2023]|nr:carbohydrate kinase [Granulosicoccaceae sp. 1_MG-2023]